VLEVNACVCVCVRIDLRLMNSGDGNKCVLDINGHSSTFSRHLMLI